MSVVNGNLCALYRYFDAERVPLYVGISGEYNARELAHIARSAWMQFAASSTIERYPTPTELRTAERAAIKAERPIFNKQYNNTAEAKRRVYAYLERAGRLDLLETGPRMIAPLPLRDPWEPQMSRADQLRKEAYERGELVELFPGGPARRKWIPGGSDYGTGFC